MESLDTILCRYRTTKALIRQRGFAGWSALLFSHAAKSSFLFAWLISSLFLSCGTEAGMCIRTVSFTQSLHCLRYTQLHSSEVDGKRTRLQASTLKNICACSSNLYLTKHAKLPSMQIAKLKIKLCYLVNH